MKQHEIKKKKLTYSLKIDQLKLMIPHDDSIFKEKKHAQLIKLLDESTPRLIA